MKVIGDLSTHGRLTGILMAAACLALVASSVALMIYDIRLAEIYLLVISLSLFGVYLLAFRLQRTISETGEPAPVTPERIDRDALLERVEGDVSLLSEMAQIFEQNYVPLLSNLRAAVRDGDAWEIERAAHTLKGMVSNFTATGAVKTAECLEDLGRHQRLAETAEALDVLERELAALRPLLSELGAGKAFLEFWWPTETLFHGACLRRSCRSGATLWRRPTTESRRGAAYKPEKDRGWHCSIG